MTAVVHGCRGVLTAESLSHELRDLAAHDLTHLVAWQFGDDDQLAGESVVGDGLFRPGTHFLKSQGCTPVFHNDRRGDLFGRIVQGKPDNGDVGHRRIAASTWEG